VSASGINPGWQRDYFIRHRICPCDPTAGQECRHCDGGAAYSSDLGAIAAAVTAVTEREQHRATPERRAG
jgi:hypothetical protein